MRLSELVTDNVEGFGLGIHVSTKDLPYRHMSGRKASAIPCPDKPCRARPFTR
jgi:hypothetical protein